MSYVDVLTIFRDHTQKLQVREESDFGRTFKMGEKRVDGENGENGENGEAEVGVSLK